VWHRATGRASFSFRSGLYSRFSLSLSLSLCDSDIILGISSSVLNDIKRTDEKNAVLMLVTRVHSESFPGFLSLMSVPGDDEFF